MVNLLQKKCSFYLTFVFVFPVPPPLKDPGDKILWSKLDGLKPPVMPVPEPTYKNLKLLDTKLDTQCDIDARKSIVWNPVKKCSAFFKSRVRVIK